MLWSAHMHAHTHAISVVIFELTCFERKPLRITGMIGTVVCSDYDHIVLCLF